MKKFLLLSLLLCGALLLHSDRAEACSCAPSPPVSEALQTSSAVFAGRVLAITEPVMATSSLDPRQVTFEVTKLWKGPLVSELTVTTALDSASCGYVFEKDKEYIVYAYHQEESRNPDDGRIDWAEERFQVSLCSRTNLLAAAEEDLAALPHAQVPPPPDSPRFSPKSPSVWWSLGGVVLVLGAVYFLGKRV